MTWHIITSPETGLQENNTISSAINYSPNPFGNEKSHPEQFHFLQPYSLYRNILLSNSDFHLLPVSQYLSRLKAEQSDLFCHFGIIRFYCIFC